MDDATAARVVLVVDDDYDCADTIAMLLERLGAIVHVAYSGESALEMLPQILPDLVLLDIGMPGMDGCEAARRIRAMTLPRPPMLVALTGWGRAEDRKRTADAGFDAHLVKPPAMDDLARLIASGG